MVHLRKAALTLTALLAAWVGFAQDSTKSAPPFQPVLSLSDSPLRAASFGIAKPINFQRVRFVYGQAIVEGRFGVQTPISGQPLAFSAGTDVRVGSVGINTTYQRNNAVANPSGESFNLGAWWNPTDMQALLTTLRWAANSTFTVEAGGSVYAPLSYRNDNAVAAQSTLFGVAYRPQKNLSLSLQYEELRRNPLSQGYAYSYAQNERWYTLGFGYKMGDRASFKFFWQLSDVDLKGLGTVNPFNNSTAQRPGLISTQVTFKF